MKRYKKYQLLFTINVFTITIFILLLTMLFIKDYNEYTKINASYILDNIVEIVITTKELKQIEKNNYIYLNSKKTKIEIISTTKNIYQRKKVYYHQILLKINGITNKNLLNISIFNKKERMINLFFDCWKEE